MIWMSGMQLEVLNEMTPAARAFVEVLYARVLEHG